MVFKLSELLEAQGSLNKLTNADLDVKAAYRIGKALSKIMSNLKDLEKTKTKLIEKYFEKDDKGRLKPPVVKEKIEAMENEWKGCQDKEVDIDLHPIPLDWLSGAQLSAGDMIALNKFIVEVNPEKK